MAKIFDRTIIFVFFFDIVYSINIGYINSAVYVPGTSTGTVLYNGTCSECICAAFLSNESSTYQAVNCYLNNNTCLFVSNFTSSSYIHTTVNSKLTFLQLSINQATESCLAAWQPCSNSTYCCSNLSCIYYNSSFSQCEPVSSVVNTTMAPVIYVNSTQNASTGSFWGCCKPSCAWPGKGAVSSPVRTCQNDGNTTIDINTASGCNYGDAYTCTNQQPWSINDTLSYGFAGAFIKGKNETQWCCACYSLIFTSDSIIGKQIIVQVVDTLYTNDNRFVLLIPGGGWTGTDNGCARQYSNMIYWGNQNDGYTNRSDCANLPSQLQHGCYWRFDWFQNAQHPSVFWTPVTCPAALTSLTGCIRS